MADRVELTRRGFDPDEVPFDDLMRKDSDQNDSECGGMFTRKGKKPYGTVPFDLIECKSLSPLARLVAVWIESKPEGWKVYPSVVQKALGITEKQWLSARRAMMAAGIFAHTKHRTKGGKWFWRNEFDITPILNSIPPSAAHGDTADIEVRKEEIRDRSRQKTVVRCADVQCAPSAPKKSLSSPRKSDVEKLKKLHIGHVLNDLGIEWYEEGKYVYWDTHNRAKQETDDHWLWIEVDGVGETANQGSAIDLIASFKGFSTAKAINYLRQIYREAMKAKT